MADSDILICQGRREHNLRDVTSLVLPRNQLIWFHRRVGGSGKSSLAFDTRFYAEGQRKRLCREPLQLRPAVPWADAEAGRRFNCRPQSIDIDFAEVQRHESPLRPWERSRRAFTTISAVLLVWRRHQASGPLVRNVTGRITVCKRGTRLSTASGCWRAVRDFCFSRR